MAPPTNETTPVDKQDFLRELQQSEGAGSSSTQKKSATTTDGKQMLLQELQEDDDPSPSQEDSVKEGGNGKNLLLQELLGDDDDNVEDGNNLLATSSPGAIRLRGRQQQPEEEKQEEEDVEQGGDTIKAEVIDEEVFRDQARMEAREELLKEAVPAEKVQIVDEESKTSATNPDRNKKTMVLVAVVLFVCLVVIGLAVAFTVKNNRNENGSDKMPTPTVAPQVDYFLHNDICALAAPVPANGGPDVVYSGDLTNSTFRNESIVNIPGLRLSGYNRWYDLTHGAGMRIYLSLCSIVDEVFMEKFDTPQGKIVTLFMEGNNGCPSTEEPLDYEFKLIRFVYWNRFFDNHTMLFCEESAYDTKPGERYTWALWASRDTLDLAESAFNFSISTNDRCEFAAELALNTPLVASNEFGGTMDSGSNPNLNVCDSLDLSGKPGSWYKVVGTGNTLIAFTCGEESIANSLIAVFGGSTTCDDSLTCIAASDNAIGTLLPLQCGHSSEVRWTSMVNETYYVAVIAGEDETSEPGEFSLQVKELAPEYLCGGAIVLDLATEEESSFVDLTFSFDGDHTMDRCVLSLLEEPRGFWLSYSGEGRKVRIHVQCRGLCYLLRIYF